MDVLVNNAGVLHVQPLAQTSDEQYEQMFNINTRGTFNMLRAAATRLADDGRVINLSSTTIALNLPGYAAYIGSKAAVEGFTRVFAKELRGRRVTVNAVAPRPVATELFMTGKSAELIEHYARLPPLERLGQPDDIAGVVAFLAGPDGGWVNGQVLRANGGVADAARRADGSAPVRVYVQDGAPGRMPRPAPAWRNPAHAGSRAPAASISRAHA